MEQLLKYLGIITILFSATLTFAQEDGTPPELIETESYKLYKPDTTDALLILFGGFPETAVNIENEFPITDLAADNNVAVAYSNINRKLWLEESEKSRLANSIQEMITSNNLPSNKIFIGGMSSGGNIALLISNYLSQNPEHNLNPSGVFVVDSPVDLAALYHVSEENIKRNFSEASVGESSFIFQYFDDQLGDPNEDIEPYEEFAAFTYETGNFQNLEDLKNTKIRLYTEPDEAWWKENMGVEYEQMNAFHLERLSDFLGTNNFENVEYITTQDKGFRANGARHPHSWSIVDKEDLLQWILEE